jgi:hypothetical protein
MISRTYETEIIILNSLNIQVHVSRIGNPCFLQFEWADLYLVVFNEVLKCKWRHLQTFILIPFVSYSPFTFDLEWRIRFIIIVQKKSVKKYENGRSVLISAIAVYDLNIETILECKGSRSQFDQHFMSSFYVNILLLKKKQTWNVNTKKANK